jgi:hypothetical protein
VTQSNPQRYMKSRFGDILILDLRPTAMALEKDTQRKFNSAF